MSKPRYIWWGYARNMIRQYQEVLLEYRRGELAETTVRYKEFDAVRLALAETEKKQTGADRCKLIKLLYWDGEKTIEGAAMIVHCSESTAKRWNGEFVRLVGRYYGLMDKK